MGHTLSILRDESIAVSCPCGETVIRVPSDDAEEGGDYTRYESEISDLQAEIKERDTKLSEAIVEAARAKQQSEALRADLDDSMKKRSEALRAGEYLARELTGALEIIYSVLPQGRMASNLDLVALREELEKLILCTPESAASVFARGKIEQSRKERAGCIVCNDPDDAPKCDKHGPFSRSVGDLLRKAYDRDKKAPVSDYAGSVFAPDSFGATAQIKKG